MYIGDCFADIHMSSLLLIDQICSFTMTCKCEIWNTSSVIQFQQS